jgi:cholesterol oxidase
VAAVQPKPAVRFEDHMSGSLLVGTDDADLDVAADEVPRLTVTDLGDPDRFLHPLKTSGLQYRLRPFEVGAEQARVNHGAQTQCQLTIDIPDSNSGQRSRRRELVPPGTIKGQVTIPGLSDNPLNVTEGYFYLAERNPSRVEVEHMLYIMRLSNDHDGPFDLLGFKVMRPGHPRQALPATTTLYVAAFDTADPRKCRAIGIMHVSGRGVLELLESMLTESRSLAGPLRVFRRFSQVVVRRYADALDEEDRLSNRQPNGPQPVEAATGIAEVWWHGDQEWVQVADDPKPGPRIRLRLTRYTPGQKTKNHPVLLTHGYGMAARSFAWPENPNRSPGAHSLAGFLLGEGFDVWLLDNRSSIALESSKRPFNLDDIARSDWPAAVAKVHDITGQDVHLFGHCVGSATLLMALLSAAPVGPGAPAVLPHVQSASCSQFLTHMYTSGWNVLKAEVHLGRLLERLRVNDLRPTDQLRWRDGIADNLLRVAPLPKGEECGLAVCRWINAIYGLTHTHQQLDDAAHRALDKLFGPAEVPGLDHLQQIVRARRLVDHRGNAAYVRDNPHGQITAPVHLLFGERNFIFHPKGNQMSAAWLTRTFPEIPVEVSALPMYAHLDAMIGPRAHVDVFPSIGSFLANHD